MDKNKKKSEPSSPLARLKEIAKWYKQPDIMSENKRSFTLDFQGERRGIQQTMKWFRWRLEKLKKQIDCNGECHGACAFRIDELLRELEEKR